jgi:hypothetical protein
MFHILSVTSFIVKPPRGRQLSNLPLLSKPAVTGSIRGSRFEQANPSSRSATLVSRRENAPSGVTAFADGIALSLGLAP